MSGTPQPRNLTIEQQSLVRRNPPPEPERWQMPQPTIPAHLIDVEQLPARGGARQFAKRAEAAGYDCHAVAAVGPKLGAGGKVGKEVATVSVRCVKDGAVQIAACWAGGRFDVAFGRRKDGGRRVATALGQVDLWLDHGVEADVPVQTMTQREAALAVIAAMGGGLVASKVRQADGSVVYLCPEIRGDADADVHLRDMHGLPGGYKSRHDYEHRWERNHVHVPRPLGDR